MQHMTHDERMANAAQLIARQMRKVNSYMKHDPFSVNRYASENQLEGMLDMLTALGVRWEIIWEDPDEMIGYDGVEVENETWFVL